MQYIYNIKFSILIILICYLSNNTNSKCLFKLYFLKILKKKLEASLLSNLEQLKINDCKLSITNIINTDIINNIDNMDNTYKSR